MTDTSREAVENIAGLMADGAFCLPDRVCPIRGDHCACTGIAALLRALLAERDKALADCALLASGAAKLRQGFVGGAADMRERAALSLQPMLRSMVSRSIAANTIRALPLVSQEKET